MAGEYVRNEVWNKTASQVAGKFDELLDHYLKLYIHEKPRMPATIDDNIVISTLCIEPFSIPTL